MSGGRNPLRINVGFILHEEVGYSHDFRFDLDNAVLGGDLALAQLRGSLSIGRTAQGLLLTGSFSADTELTCVRCLTSFWGPLSWKFTEMFALSEKSVSESGLVVPEDAHIDLQPLLRDYALLEVPIKALCKLDCRGLCPICGQDRNKHDCGHQSEAGNSPFAALKDFLQD